MNGTDAAEVFAVTANGTRVSITRDIGNVLLDLATIERLTHSANGGNDSILCTGNLGALTYITIDGGQGDDALSGSNGIDVILAAPTTTPSEPTSGFEPSGATLHSDRRRSPRKEGERCSNWRTFGPPSQQFGLSCKNSRSLPSRVAPPRANL
jgi:hypothetical protein